MPNYKGGTTLNVLLTFLCLLLALIGFGLWQVPRMVNGTKAYSVTSRDDIAGKYIAEIQSGNETIKRSVELLPDGRFIYWKRENDDIGLSGSYNVSGETISFTFLGGSNDGIAIKARFELYTGRSTVGRYEAPESGLPNDIITNDDIFGKSSDSKGIDYIKEGTVKYR